MINVEQIVEMENEKNRNIVNLIASENYMFSELVYLKKLIMSKYAEGNIGKRYYSGCQNIDKVEQFAINNFKQIFNCKYVIIQALSGSIANLAILSAFYDDNKKEKEVVLVLKLKDGSHLSHGFIKHFSRKLFNYVYFSLYENQIIDYKHLIFLIKKIRPIIVIVGFSVYSYDIDYEIIKKACMDTKSLLFADISHTSGLIVSKVLSNPFPYADIVMTTTHKTLKGSKGAIIMCNKKIIYDKIFSALFPGLQGGPNVQSLFDLALLSQLIQKTDFYFLNKRIVANTKFFISCLKSKGFSIFSSSSENHMFLLSTKCFGFNGLESQKILESVNIFVNANIFPIDSNFKDVSGIRIGMAAITSLGFCLDHIEILSNIFYELFVLKKEVKLIKKRVKFLLLSLKQNNIKNML